RANVYRAMLTTGPDPRRVAFVIAFCILIGLLPLILAQNSRDEDPVGPTPLTPSNQLTPSSQPATSTPALVEVEGEQPPPTAVAPPTAMAPPTAVATPSAVEAAPAEDWTLRANRGTIKGFADKVSAANGETVSVFVTTPAPSFAVTVYRLGWYDQ